VVLVSGGLGVLDTLAGALENAAAPKPLLSAGLSVEATVPQGDVFAAALNPPKVGFGSAGLSGVEVDC
jgi:hypothetical protein